ncbi:hypothetical protein ES703_50711 [subsurface metagenome]
MSGDNCMKTLSALGFTDPGFIPEIPNSFKKLVEYLICMPTKGRVNPLSTDDYVICADEKTSIQARIRKRPTAPPYSGEPMRVEHEYIRSGHGPIFLLEMFTAQESLVAVKRGAELNHLTDWWTR